MIPPFCLFCVLDAPAAGKVEGAQKNFDACRKKRASRAGWRVFLLSDGRGILRLGVELFQQLPPAKSCQDGTCRRRRQGRTIPFVAACTSDSGWAVDTLANVLSGRDIPVAETELFREIYFGEEDSRFLRRRVHRG